MRKFSQLAFFALALIVTTLAQLDLAVAQRNVVSEIIIRGNKKIEKDAVLERLVTKVGQVLTAKSVRSDVEEIFNTGYFFNTGFLNIGFLTLIIFLTLVIF